MQVTWKYYFLFALQILILYPILAQNEWKQPDIIRCATTRTFHEQRMFIDTVYRSHVEAHLRFLKEQSGKRNPDCSSGPIIIPVAVHFDQGIVPFGQEECAISLAIDQIESLNIEINGSDPQNSVYSSLQNCFPGSPPIGESCLEFCLAVYNHPGGYGLTEGEPAVTFGQIDFSNTSGNTVVPLDPNWAGYFNIFVGDLSGGLLGQSAGIPGQFSGEGVVLDECVFGTGTINCLGMNSSATCGGIYDEGNTLVHEAGHYFGLFHIWGDNTICTGIQDDIDDTPDMDSSYVGYTSCSDFSCSDLPESCSSKDMYMNYMSYASDACMYLFTAGQADVIYLTAMEAGFDANLPPQCQMPELPVANFSFTPDPAAFCPAQGIISFTDLSLNNPDSWNWTFSGAGVAPSSSASMNPTVTVQSSGTLMVTLTVSNIAGTSTPYVEYIPVIFWESDNPLCDLCQYTLEMYDSFGDGWNDASVTVYLDNVPVYSLTLIDGGFESQNFEVEQSQEIELVFIGGTWDDEISFDLKNAYGALLFHQGINAPDGTIFTSYINCDEFTCGILEFDSGGMYNPYSNNEAYNWTLCPDMENYSIRIVFNEFDVEAHPNCEYDVLSVYNGLDTDHLIGQFCNDNLPGTITSTSVDGCLNFEFQSDAYIAKDGWNITVECVEPCLKVTNSADSGEGSLRYAINCANPGDIITFSENLSGSTIQLSGEGLTIDKSLTLFDPGNTISISGNNGSPVISISENTFLTIEGLNINGTSTADNPILNNNGQLRLKNLSITDYSTNPLTISVQNTGDLEIDGTVTLFTSN